MSVVVGANTGQERSADSSVAQTGANLCLFGVSRSPRLAQFGLNKVCTCYVSVDGVQPLNSAVFLSLSCVHPREVRAPSPFPLGCLCHFARFILTSICLGNDLTPLKQIKLVSVVTRGASCSRCRCLDCCTTICFKHQRLLIRTNSSNITRVPFSGVLNPH